MDGKHLKKLLKAVGRRCVQETRDTDAKVITMHSQQSLANESATIRSRRGMS